MFKDGLIRTLSYATRGSACFDLKSSEDAIICLGERKLIDVGIQLEIPIAADIVLMICSRSGLANKHGVFVLNSPGIVDSDYVGPIKVLLCNFGEDEFEIKKGDRIAQMMLLRVVKPNNIAVGTQTRGDCGFGSTGK